MRRRAGCCICPSLNLATPSAAHIEHYGRIVLDRGAPQRGRRCSGGPRLDRSEGLRDRARSRVIKAALCRAAVRPIVTLRRRLASSFYALSVYEDVHIPIIVAVDVLGLSCWTGARRRIWHGSSCRWRLLLRRAPVRRHCRSCIPGSVIACFLEFVRNLGKCPRTIRRVVRLGRCIVDCLYGSSELLPRE
jgi:hypothetical protein